LLHLSDERASVGEKVETVTVLGRDDELPQPLVAGLLPSTERCREVHVLALGVEALALGALALRAFSRQVGAVRAPRGAPAIARVRGLHSAALQPARGHVRDGATARADSGPPQTGS